MRHWSASKSLIRREPIFDSGETNCAYAPEFAFFGASVPAGELEPADENARVVTECPYAAVTRTLSRIHLVET